MFVQTQFFKIVVGVIAAIQVVLGVLMIFAPAQFADFSGLSEAPEWTAWLFAMFGARCLGYAVGLVAALRDPVANRLWLQTMIGIQAVDWIATLGYLAAGTVTIGQVKTAAIAPLFFIAVLLPTIRLARSRG
jgi:hypothetical protein